MGIVEFVAIFWAIVVIVLALFLAIAIALIVITEFDKFQKGRKKWPGKKASSQIH